MLDAIRQCEAVAVDQCTCFLGDNDATYGSHQELRLIGHHYCSIGNTIDSASRLADLLEPFNET